MAERPSGSRGIRGSERGTPSVVIRSPAAVAAGGSLPRADQLIPEAATGARRLSDEELREVLEHVAQAGFERLQEDSDGNPSRPWHYAEWLAWRRDLTRLEHGLDGPYRSGQMTPEQVARYRALLLRLEKALPTIERLGFAKPMISLEP